MLDWGLLALGLLMLIAGGEGLVRGASGIALSARLSPAVIGLTIVAAGTSTPELVVSVQSALSGSSGIALGNVVGSNIFNIGAIIGIAALVSPLRVVGNTVRMEWPIMMMAALCIPLFARDGHIDRAEGAFLFVSMIAFTAFAVWLGRRAAPSEEEGYAEVVTAAFGSTGARAVFYNVFALLVGVGLLAAGSTLLVRGAVSIASGLGVSETVIGLTIVAAGTSTPELVTSLVAAARGRDDIAIANVVGSNIFNVLAILGATALVTPLEVPDAIMQRDVWWMLGFSAVLLPLMKSGLRVTRWEGAVLFALFLVYMGVLLSANL